MLPLVFSRAEALAEGHTPAQVDALVRSGVWTALRRAVYAATDRLPADSADRHAADVAAAVRATTREVVGSHESAALVHGLSTFSSYDGPPVLSRVRAVEDRRPAGCSAAVLVSQIPPGQVIEVRGAAVTTVARTAVDLARKGPRLSSVVVADAAMRSGCSRAELEAVLSTQKGWPGSRSAAEVVAFADARAESALESVSRWRMHQLELPRPELQVGLHDRFGFIGRVDFLFREQRVVGEADGLGKYRGPRPADETDDALGLEKLREDRLRDAGYEVFRWTWDIAVRRPVVLEERARRAFARALLRAA